LRSLRSLLFTKTLLRDLIQGCIIRASFLGSSSTRSRNFN